MAYSTESGKKGPKDASMEGLRGCKFKVPARRSLDIAAGFALALLFHFEIANALGARAQSVQATDARPSFEVVSIRPSHPGDQGAWASDASRFVVTAVTARYLIEYAYNDFKAGAILRDDQLLGGPSWINTEKWAINAKVDDSVADKLRMLPREEEGKEIGLMVRSMLADRFKLRVHHETRVRAVYALVASKGGPKFLNTQFTNTDVKASQLKGPGDKPLPPVTPGLRRFWSMAPYRVSPRFCREFRISAGWCWTRLESRGTMTLYSNGNPNQTPRQCFPVREMRARKPALRGRPTSPGLQSSQHCGNSSG
jgi:hypothetical protein